LDILPKRAEEGQRERVHRWVFQGDNRHVLVLGASNNVYSGRHCAFETVVARVGVFCEKRVTVFRFLLVMREKNARYKREQKKSVLGRILRARAHGRMV
jgi:hypothetical protein